MVSSQDSVHPVPTFFGGGTGTLIIYFAEKMSDKNDAKYWIIVATPLIAVGVAHVGELIRRAWQRHREDRWCSNMIKLYEKNSKKATTEEEREECQKNLANLRRIEVQLKERRMPSSMEEFLASSTQTN
jgi:hypothetical protein